MDITGGHLDVVQLLVSAGADVDSQDNRKVSCLMAAFRKGHVKVVKWKVKHVTQFPSDAELQRFIATVTDKVSLFSLPPLSGLFIQWKDVMAWYCAKICVSRLPHSMFFMRLGCAPTVV